MNVIREMLRSVDNQTVRYCYLLVNPFSVDSGLPEAKNILCGLVVTLLSD
jgi:hypothetical protein